MDQRSWTQPLNWDFQPGRPLHHHAPTVPPSLPSCHAHIRHSVTATPSRFSDRLASAARSLGCETLAADMGWRRPARPSRSPPTMVVAVLAAIAASALGMDAGQLGHWVTLNARWETTWQLVNQSGLIAFSDAGAAAKPIDGRSFAAIATGPDGGGDLSVHYPGGRDSAADTFNFSLADSRPGAKARVELTTCFATTDTLRRHGLDPGSVTARQLAALNFIYQNCSGAPSVPASALGSAAVTHHLQYDVFVGSSFPGNGQAILGQFHGRPDPRLFRAPNGTVHRLATSEAYAVCSGAATLPPATGNTAPLRWSALPGKSAFCNKGVVSNASGHPTGWSYQEGGYPPLTFSYAHDQTATASPGWWVIGARSDARVMSPKADCGWNPARPSDWPTRRCPDAQRETVNGLWRAPFETLVGRWIVRAGRCVGPALTPVPPPRPHHVSAHGHERMRRGVGNGAELEVGRAVEQV